MNSPKPFRKKAGALVIAASTGGPQGVLQICEKLKKHALSIPTFIVLHMPDGFAQIVAAQIHRVTGLPTHASTDGVLAQPGHIYIANSGSHLKVAKKGLRIFLQQEDNEAINYCKPSADTLFASAASVYGPNLVAVVLSGMGIDGLNGCREIADAGGTIFVQDENSSAVWGMPGAIARSGMECQILSPDQIANKLQLLFGRGEHIPA